MDDKQSGLKRFLVVVAGGALGTVLGGLILRSLVAKKAQHELQESNNEN